MNPTVHSIQANVNRHAATNIVMRGTIDENSLFRGEIEGTTPDDIHKALQYISAICGLDFNTVGIRHGQASPPTFVCKIEFAATEFDNKEAYLDVECLSCGQLIRFTPNFAGTISVCPKCKNDVVVGVYTRENISEPSKHAAPHAAPSTAINLSQIYFKSSRHTRFNPGDNSGILYENCNRAVEIKPDTDFENSYFVTIYNLDSVHPQWGDNIQVAPKRMKVIESSDKHFTLCGYGDDPMLAGRPQQIQSYYGIRVILNGNNITCISLYYHDRNVRLDYQP